MTDKLIGCTVAFDRLIREDDAEEIISVIRMLKGVLDVSPNIYTHQDWEAETRVRSDLISKIYGVLEAK